MMFSFTHNVSTRRFCRMFLFLCFVTFCTASWAQERFVFISHAPDTDSWWNTIKNAIKHAEEDFGVRVEYRNPKDGSIQEMARIIDQAVESKPDGIVSTIADYAVLKDALTRVTQNKTPLITVNSGTYAQSEAVGAIMHIGQPEGAAGKAAGVKAAQAGVKSFVCLNHQADNSALHERCNGFAEGLGLKEAKELAISGDEKSMETQIGSFLAKQEKNDAILGLGSQSTQALLNALKTAKPEKPPYIVTFDLSGAITTAIKNNQIAFAIDQQPYLQGYLSIGMLTMAARSKGATLATHKLSLYSNMKLHKRMSDYDLTLLSFGKRHIDSGPGFVTRVNVDKVEMYSGKYR